MDNSIKKSTFVFNFISKFGINKLRKYNKIFNVLSIINYQIFFRNSIGKRFNIRVSLDIKLNIKIYFISDGFHIIFSQNPGIPDLYGLFGYIQKYKPKRGDIIIDGGAYHGLSTMYFSKLVGCEGKIYAFEPDKKNSAILKNNLELNNINNVEIVNKGLSDNSGMMNFNSCGEMYSSFVKNNKNIELNNNIIQVEVISINDFINNKNINKISFIKADIEGSEIGLIKGIKNIKQLKNTNYAIASYHVLPGEKENTSKRVEKLLCDLGYNVEIGWGVHLTVYAWGNE